MNLTPELHPAGAARCYRWFGNMAILATLNFIALAQNATNAGSPAPPSVPSTTATAIAKLPASPSPAPLQIGSLTISGSLRLRAESWNWYDTDKAEDAYTFGAGTLRLAIGQQREQVEWQLEGATTFFYGLPTNAIAPAPQGQLGLGAAYWAANGRQDAGFALKQAFVRFKGLGSDKKSSLKLGRFEFNDGTEIIPSDATLATVKRDHISQRLIGTFSFTHVGRSFDGVHYARTAKAGNFTFVAARPTEGVFQLRGIKELNVDFYYGAFTKPLKHKSSESEVRAFVLHYHDGRRVLKTDDRPAALRAADLGKIRLTTIGGHYIAVRKLGAGKADFLVWGAGQFGDWGNLTQRSGAIAAEAGYQFPGKLADKIKPWVRAGYFRSTGDGNPNDQVHGTYFQVLPTPRIYARFPFFNEMNNEDVFGQLRLKPHRRVALRTDLHHLRLSSKQDLWYLGGGVFQDKTFGFIGRPSLGQQNLGWFGDVSADFTLTSRTTFTFYIGGSADGKVQKALYPQGNRARFGYFELTQRF